MATLTIRKLDPELKARLRVRAAQHGRSMEEEMRLILKAALADERMRGGSLFEFIRGQVEPLGGVELEASPPEPVRAPPTFDR